MLIALLALVAITLFFALPLSDYKQFDWRFWVLGLTHIAFFAIVTSDTSLTTLGFTVLALIVLIDLVRLTDLTRLIFTSLRVLLTLLNQDYRRPQLVTFN
jgi:hypothetical protein